jgi:hypothetical protein
MSRDARIGAPNNPVDFSCRNRKFQTNIERGFADTPSQTRGSAIPAPLVQNNGWTLWLEYVSELEDPDTTWFWLMWYAPDGLPTIPLSGVFDRNHLADMIRQLVEQEPAIR